MIIWKTEENSSEDWKYFIESDRRPKKYEDIEKYLRKYWIALLKFPQIFKKEDNDEESSLIRTEELKRRCAMKSSNFLFPEII